MPPSPPDLNGSIHQSGSLNREKITLRSTHSGETMDVVVLTKRADLIQVILGEGPHSVFCELVPARDALFYIGNARGRDIVYERSRAQVQADIEKENPAAPGIERR